MARVHVLQEVRYADGNIMNPAEEVTQWTLCFQYCTYVYDRGEHERGEVLSENGYRFIWRHPGGNLQAARGQARIPSIEVAKLLMDKAHEEGWGANDDW